MYLPGIIEGSVLVGGLVSSAYTTAATTALDTFYSGLATAGLVPTLLHSEGAAIATPLPITSFEIQGRVATQRRRNRR
jgi:hypothetical protein